MEDLILVQEQLEKGMREYGVSRYLKAIERRKQHGEEADTSYGKTLIKRSLLICEEALREDMERDSNAVGRHNKALKYLRQGELKPLIFIAMRFLFNGISAGRQLQTLCRQIGQAIMDEVNGQAYREQFKESGKKLQQQAAKRVGYTYRRELFRAFQNNSEDFTTDRWDTDTQVVVGAKMISIIIEKTGLFYIQSTREKHKSCKYLLPTKACLDAIENHVEMMSEICVSYQPMVIPPNKWEEGSAKGGGYISPWVKPLHMVKTRNETYLSDLAHMELKEVRSALNAAQETAWKINLSVLEVMEKAYELNNGMAELPLRIDEDPIPAPHENATEEEVDEYRQDRRNQFQRIRANKGRRIQFVGTLTCAQRYKEFENIYFPYQLDFRGRLYSVTNGSLSPQGADFSKGLLHFAEAKPLGERGLYWLKVHMANLMGVDKVSFDERVAYVDENWGEFIKCGKDPLANLLWTEADKPWQALAVCLELVGVDMEGEDFASRIPIALDGSCSGLQNLGACLRCEDTGREVNLLPADKPADIYQKVADRVIASLALVSPTKCDKEAAIDAAKEQMKLVAAEHGITTPKRLANTIEKALSDCPRDKLSDAAKEMRSTYHRVVEGWAWLKFGISRKTTKRAVMTFPYGSKKFGFKEQLMEDILIPTYRELSTKLQQGEITQKEYEEQWPFSGRGHLAANVLADEIYSAVKATVVKASEAMDWMQQTARLVTRSGRTISWTTPLGFPVQQRYFETKERRVRTTLCGETYWPRLAEATDKPDTRASANAISPNVVHSLDASHLMMVVGLSAKGGINSFALIHDSFGTHAADTDKLFWLIRRAFVELYQENYLVRLKGQLTAQVNPEYREDVPELPEEGQLDLEAILKSAYAFA
ncbi:DNA-directed RNA polymerase [Microbulbifer sp. JMSA002]|uniref:DNA-directed RNA polymerase n=1 Tax=Microbulbifer sp. JMSA002 TaxID=3243368 RepID=UPI00403A7B06